MRILLCCERFFPSVGGVQKVIRELGERLAVRGHNVTVATTKRADRSFDTLNGIAIRDFTLKGNMVLGMQGEVERYQQFILSEPFDAMLVYAAQQWTFDALWPILDKIQARKVHVPCGYSGFYDPSYRDYFRQMPGILRQFDHLVFNALDYRDINFAKDNGLRDYSIIPNGASEIEFNGHHVADFRNRWGIPQQDFLFLSVGSPPLAKGHQHLAQAYAQVPIPFSSTLILDGHYERRDNPETQTWLDRLKLWIRNVLQQIFLRQQSKAHKLLGAYQAIRRQPSKRIIFTDLPRADMISAFFSADLFVFASQVEYSPLVLFESAAAGLPFLSVPVGNAVEIAQWTGAGEIIPASRDVLGRMNVSVPDLAAAMVRLAADRAELERLGKQGRENWKHHYTWEKIALQYEAVLQG